MATHSLIHVSDLHFGRHPRVDGEAAVLAASLAACGADHVALTGDVTDRGRRRELLAFRDAFTPLMRARRLTAIPGNHDRLGDDVGPMLMPGPRVQVERREGLWLVRLDSTGPHNRRLVCGHGVIYDDDIRDTVRALEMAPPRHLVCLLLHHHPLPLPEENIVERFSRWIGRPWALELAAGLRLLQAIRGRCDLVLHGHRHTPAELTLFDGEARPLRVFNAGMTTRLGRARMFLHSRGELVSEPTWLGLLPGFAAEDRRPQRPLRVA